ncbi:TPA: hypothetical protein VGS70_004578 [Vibrio parahaemolyticus]|uniref:hypothetical protein n=3 Tax=Vibrio parahaemolyticus TaxID=670 RepID=UPI00186A8DD2|nr:hypothetical protein [Vibrio parahaemolyticus]MBE3696217.1 hypothetical protein [Vibrio parahaemolyticus]MCR9808322.1 hypothetical protein [Vibrio parahaemolyticus]MCR9928242.1 hypothetical protein [Vibrio parahaemolyticus]HBC3593005.1 hypothetical protein [Vibrio parahaemolyticus]HBC3917485.1 hypothetical protein [Vibrio parahaemolyticus]
MQKSDQVSLYFLSDLEKFRIFVELSERHWREELTTYNESDIEMNESVCWDRYKYRNDLGAHFQEVFPQYQKQSFLLMLVSLFEDYLNQLCHSFHFEKGLNCTLKDYSGSGIERAKNYLRKVAKIEVPTGTVSWGKVVEARDIRNIIAHNAGHLDKELHSKQFRIVAKNLNLNSHQFARVHLEVTQVYIFEIIDAMASVVNELWRETTENA